jgi:hypothetical protein
MATESPCYSASPTEGNQSPNIKSWGRMVNLRSEYVGSTVETEQVEVVHTELSRGLEAEICDRQIGSETVSIKSDVVYVRPRRSSSLQAGDMNKFSRINSDGSRVGGCVSLEGHARIQASWNANFKVRDSIL